VKLPNAQIIATIMENVLMENVTAELDLLEMIVLFVLAHQIATVTENVSTTLANVTMDTLDLIVLSDHAVLNVPETDIVTMELASANQDSQVFLVLSQLVHHLVLEMDDAFQLELKWHANVILDLKDMIALRKHAQVIAQHTENALTEFAHAIMVGEEMIVHLDALDTDKDVVETENVLRVNVIVTLVGLVMVVILELVSMIAHNTDIAAMEHVFAKRDTEEEIVPSLQNHNPANVLFIASEVVFNNALKFMKLKVLDHPMNVTLNAHKNVFHFALLEKCLMELDLYLFNNETPFSVQII